MGKAGRWLKSILAGRKDKALHPPYHHQQQGGDATPLPASPREKKRWSFRRPAPAQQGKASSSNAAAAPSPLSSSSLDPSSARELEQSEHAVAVAVAAAAAADAAVVAAAEAAAAVACLTMAAEEEGHLAVISCNGEDAAAARIQATFRGYLARKALCALRGLVKLQALVRGQLVRRQATATLRRMQALVDAQSRLRAQRARMLDADHGATPPAYQYQARRSPQHHQHIPRRRSSYEVMERASGEEHVKIVEMDVGEPARQRGRSSCSAAATESRDRRLAEYYHHGGGVVHDAQCSPAPSSFFGGDLSIGSPPRAYSGHFEDVFAFDPAAAATARSSPYTAPYDAYAADADAYGGVVPSYMANTESSRAKARSQSAPRQRTDPAAALERQPSGRRRGGAPRKMMQRSSSHIGVPAAAAACGYGGGYGGYGYGYGGYQQQQQQHAQPPWAGVRLDRSSASVAGSECGSTSSVLTAATVGYCRSLVGFEVQRGHY